MYHGWCEITENGVNYTCDPDLEYQFCKRVGLNWKLFMVPYTQMPCHLRVQGVICR